MKKKAENKVLEPIIQPSVITLPEVNNLNPGQCIICKVDEQGNEVDKSCFTTSLRMWDNTYSKNKIFKLKKK